MSSRVNHNTFGRFAVGLPCPPPRRDTTEVATPRRVSLAVRLINSRLFVLISILQPRIEHYSSD